MLSQLIYVSTAQKLFEDSVELDRILVSSARNNAAREITGMLLYAGGTFLQILEGEEAAIAEIWERISQDPRHFGISVIDRSQISERSFGGWHMGFRRLGPSDAEAHPAYAAFFRHGFDAESIGAKPGVALDILKAFAERSR
jgi:hypothetical protein